MKIINIILKVILSAILIMPIFGTLGIFPAPTSDMYNSPEAFAFIQLMMNSQYITVMMSVVFLVSLISIWIKRESLAALLLLPISLNIVGFHAFLDGGLLTGGAIMGNILLLINIYLLWKNRDQFKSILNARS
jgi:hypothetical protein